METNLEKQHVRIFHEPLFQVFIDVRKAYDSVGRGICMEIIRGCGMGPKLQGLLQRYWDRKKVVPKAGKFFGYPFNTERVVTQGYPVSPMIFDIVMEAVVRAVLLEVCRPQEAQHGFGWVAGEHNICFYADYGRIAGRNLIWVQAALAAMVRMF